VERKGIWGRLGTRLQKLNVDEYKQTGKISDPNWDHGKTTQEARGMNVFRQLRQQGRVGRVTLSTKKKKRREGVKKEKCPDGKYRRQLGQGRRGAAGPSWTLLHGNGGI